MAGELKGAGVSTADVREALLSVWSEQNAEKGESGLSVTGGKDAGLAADAGQISTFKAGGIVSPLGAAIQRLKSGPDFAPRDFVRSPLVEQDAATFENLVRAKIGSRDAQSGHVARPANAKATLKQFGAETQAPQQLVIDKPPPLNEDGRRILDLTLVTHVSAHVPAAVVEQFKEHQEYAVRITTPDGQRHDLDPIVGENSAVALKDLSLELLDGKTTIEVWPKGSAGVSGLRTRRVTEIYFNETPPEVQTPRVSTDRNGRPRSTSEYYLPIAHGPAPDGTLPGVSLKDLPKPRPGGASSDPPPAMDAAKQRHASLYTGPHRHLASVGQAFVPAGAIGELAANPSFVRDEAGGAMIAADNASLHTLRFGYLTGKPMEAWIADPPEDGKLKLRMALRRDEVEKDNPPPRLGEEALHGDYQVHITYPDGGSERFRVDKHEGDDKVTVTAPFEIDLERARGGNVVICGYPEFGDVAQYPEARATILHVDSPRATQGPERVADHLRGIVAEANALSSSEVTAKLRELPDLTREEAGDLWTADGASARREINGLVKQLAAKFPDAKLYENMGAAGTMTLAESVLHTDLTEAFFNKDEDATKKAAAAFLEAFPDSPRAPWAKTLT